MSPRQALPIAALLLAASSLAPALADSQSSNSSSNCSNGVCTRTDSHVVEDRAGRRGWVRTETWDEDGGRRARGQAPRQSYAVPPIVVIIPGLGVFGR